MTNVTEIFSNLQNQIASLLSESRILILQVRKTSKIKIYPNRTNKQNQCRKSKDPPHTLFYIYPPSIAPLLSESRILILQIPKTKLKIQYTQIKQINRINTETQNPYLTLLFYIYPPPIAPLLSESKMLCLDYPLKLTKLPKCP